MASPTRAAAPTAAPPYPDNASSEGRADPHGIHWMRGAPPITAGLYAAAALAGLDLVGESKRRKADDKGNGTGNGRRASGFRVPNGDGGTLVFVDGCGNTETWALASGEGDGVEMVSIVSWGGTALRIYW